MNVEYEENVKEFFRSAGERGGLKRPRDVDEAEVQLVVLSCAVLAPCYSCYIEVDLSWFDSVAWVLDSSCAGRGGGVYVKLHKGGVYVILHKGLGVKSPISPVSSFLVFRTQVMLMSTFVRFRHVRGEKPYGLTPDTRS